MRFLHLACFCIALFVLVPAASPAQTVTQPSLTVSQIRTELELGSVTVWLGMPEAAALHQFHSVGYRVRENSSGVSSYCYVLIGSTEYPVFFKEGKLAFAERDWNVGKTVMTSVLGALISLENHGAKSCTISHTLSDNRLLPKPGATTSEWVVIYCQDRSLQLMDGTVNVDGKTLSATGIKERIGMAW